MKEDSKKKKSTPAPLSPTQVETLIRSGPEAAEIAHIFEAHSRGSKVVSDIAAETSGQKKGTPVASTPEEARLLDETQQPTAKTQRTANMRGDRPKLKPERQ
jgi:hypothetical protein